MKKNIKFDKILKSSDIKKEDIIVFKYEEISEYDRAALIKELRKRIPAETLVLFIKEENDISLLDEKQMNKLGLYKK